MILLISLPVWGLAEVTKVVDPDNGGGTDYTSLDAYEDALGGTTTGHLPNDDQIAIAQCRSSSGGDDTTPVIFTGWTTDATRYIKVTGGEGVGDFPISTGILDETKYLLHNDDASIGMAYVREDYFRIENIQFKVTETSTNTRFGLYVDTGITATNNDIRVDGCIFKGVCSGTGSANGIAVTDTDTNIKIWNTIVYGFFISADTGFRGINLNCATANIYNCTVYNCTRAIARGGGTVTAINCLVFNNDDDFNGTIAMTYCASDDDHTGDSATNFVITQTAGNYAALVTDAPNGDFSVTDASSELYQTGNGATPKALFTDDIIGTTRGPADLDWDIGAFELVTAGVTIPVFMYHYMNH